MKKSIIFVLSSLIADVAWASCVPTEHMLENGTSAEYDEYLYEDSSQYELRKEGKTGVAYLCGYGYCDVGTKMRMKGATLGGQARADKVYECRNTSTGARYSFKWVEHDISPTCTVNNVMLSKPVNDVENAGTLYEINGRYCEKVVSSSQQVVVNQQQVKKTTIWDAVQTVAVEKGATIRNVFDNVTNVTVETLSDGTEIIVTYAKENTKRLKIFADGTVGIVTAAGNTIVGTWQTSVDGVVRIYDSSLNAAVGGLRILKDGTVEVFNSVNKTIQTITQEAGESYRATLSLFGTVITEFSETVREVIRTKAQIVGVTIQEIGATIRNVFDNVTNVTVETLNDGTEIIVSYAKENTKRLKIFADGTVGLATAAGNTIVGTWKTSVDGVVRIYDSSVNAVVGGLRIVKDGTVEIFNSANKTIQTITQEAGESYRATLALFGTVITEFSETVREVIRTKAQIVGVTIQEIGATIRNVFDNVTNVTVETLSDGTEIIVTYAKENTKRLKIFADGTVGIVTAAGNTIVGTWKTSVDGVVRIYDSSLNAVVGGLRILKDGTVEVFNSVNKTIQTITQEAGESYRATLALFGTVIQEFGETTREIIRAKAQVVGVTIHEIGETVRTAMHDATDFAKHFTTEIIGGVEALQINKARLNALEERIAACTTQEQVAAIVEEALREAELSDKQCAQVRAMIGEYEKKTNQRLTVISNRVSNLEQELAEVKEQTIIMSYQIAGLGAQYNNLAAQVRTKVNAKQVVQLIVDHTQKFSYGQEQQLYEILAEYTKNLSAGQRAEVQDMIAEYVDPKVARLDKRINLESERRAAENRVLSAMSVLNAFAASADVSVWKTAEGKFNGARLASDSVAGVVLGTAGGLITNSLIKKSQTKKGFEDISCSVGGQIVAGYDDEFMAGIQ